MLCDPLTCAGPEGQVRRPREQTRGRGATDVPRVSPRQNVPEPPPQRAGTARLQGSSVPRGPGSVKPLVTARTTARAGARSPASRLVPHAHRHNSGRRATGDVLRCCGAVAAKQPVGSWAPSRPACRGTTVFRHLHSHGEPQGALGSVPSGATRPPAVVVETCRAPATGQAVGPPPPTAPLRALSPARQRVANVPISRRGH